MIVPEPLDSKTTIDAFLPKQMAQRAEDVGVKKAELPVSTMFILALLAGAFIALGSVFSTTVTAGAGAMPFGVTKLLGGVTFSLGLILVVVAGAELFTGNNLIVMAMASKKITLSQMLRCWLIVFLGNFVGSIATAVGVLIAGHHMHGNGAVGLNLLQIAASKCELGFLQAVALGVLCNALVCLAIWLCYSARSSTDKILSIIFPITAFVAAGFEHCVANMYLIPIGILTKQFAADEFWQAIGAKATDFEMLTWNNFFVANLIPVTIGNIFGGSVMVGLVYWYVYLRQKNTPSS